MDKSYNMKMIPTTLCFKEKPLDEFDIVSFIELKSSMQYFSEINLRTSQSKSNIVQVVDFSWPTSVIGPSIVCIFVIQHIPY